MASAIWPGSLTHFFDPRSATLASGAKAWFFDGTTDAPFTTYKDAAHANPHPHPVVANSSGLFPTVYMTYGTYRVRVETAAGELIYDIDDIANPAPPDTPSSGGGGLIVTTPQIFTTGMIIPRLEDSPLDGWVPLAGGSIGSPSSGASARANDDCYDLFGWNWQRLDDTKCPVSGGRGATSTDDWVAGKTLTLLDSKNAILIGRSGQSAEPNQNGIQIVTTCSATNGSNSVSVDSAIGIVKNMNVWIDGVATGTVSLISGTTLTLSTNYTGPNGSGKAFKASFFLDPEKCGSRAGFAYTTMDIDQMPSHDHPPIGGKLDLVGGAVIAVSGGSFNGVAAGNTGLRGGGQPQTNLPISLTCMLYQKL